MLDTHWMINAGLSELAGCRRKSPPTLLYWLATLPGSSLQETVKWPLTLQTQPSTPKLSDNPVKDFGWYGPFKDRKKFVIGSSSSLLLLYICQLCECHACGSKTSIPCIEDNFSRLTHKSGQLVQIQFNSLENILINGARCRVWVLTVSERTKM